MTELRVPTTCTMDCPDTCALEVLVEDGRVTALRGRRDHPTTAGFICAKVGRFHQRLYHPDRILHPLRRVGAKGEGRFEAISWDQALDAIAARFRDIEARWGSEAILPFHYGGSNGFLGDGPLDDLFFARLGASRLARTFCAAPATKLSEEMYGRMPGVAFEDFVHARCIVIWGANPRNTHIHLVPFLKEARRRGAFLAVVDPVRSFPDGDIDLHLPIRPGTDVALALALVREAEQRGWLARSFLDEHCTGVEALLSAARPWDLSTAAATCGLEERAIQRLAQAYHGASPALLRCGWGLERNLNGGAGIAAILALPAVYGKYGLRGGGYTLSNSGAARLDPARHFPLPPWPQRELNMSQLGALLEGPLDPPVKSLFVYNANPVATAPDQNSILRGLAREDLFTVVHEQVMTDTARWADLVLPAVTFLEQVELKRGYGSLVVGGVRPVVPPEGEAWPNEAVFSALAHRLGFTDEPFTWDSTQLQRHLAGALDLGEVAADPELLAEGRCQELRFAGGTPIPFVNSWPRTADRKAHLAPPCLGPLPYSVATVADPRFPLALVSPASPHLISSTFGEFNLPELRATMHPADAEPRGISDGQPVRLWNEGGEVHCAVDLSDRIRPGVVLLPKGAWRKASRNGQTAAALVPGHVEPTAGGACYNDARVQAEPLGRPA